MCSFSLAVLQLKPWCAIPRCWALTSCVCMYLHKSLFIYTPSWSIESQVVIKCWCMEHRCAPVTWSSGLCMLFEIKTLLIQAQVRTSVWLCMSPLMKHEGINSPNHHHYHKNCCPLYETSHSSVVMCGFRKFLEQNLAVKSFFKAWNYKLNSIHFHCFGVALRAIANKTKKYLSRLCRQAIAESNSKATWAKENNNLFNKLWLQTDKELQTPGNIDHELTRNKGKHTGRYTHREPITGTRHSWSRQALDWLTDGDNEVWYATAQGVQTVWNN